MEYNELIEKSTDGIDTQMEALFRLVAKQVTKMKI